MSAIAVLGAGAYGTALAVALASDGKDVTLFARDAKAARAMSASRTSGAKLPGISLPEHLKIESGLPRPATDILLLAVPMAALPEVLEVQSLADCGHLVACMKGIDPQTGCTPSRLIKTALPSSVASILTGPSFAIDIAKGLPTALTLATANATVGKALQENLSTRTLRLYRTTDVIGAEFGGAMKNVIAIAAGVAIGAGLGDSARAAIIARGMAEISRVATHFGAQPETLSGLSGLGDLVLTASSAKSRNYSAGLALGSGQALPNVTTEGLSTALAVSEMVKKHNLDAPIASTIASLILNETSVERAIADLLARPLKEESS